MHAQSLPSGWHDPTAAKRRPEAPSDRICLCEDRVLDRLIAKPRLRFVRRPIRLSWALVTRTVVDPAKHSRVSLAIEFERYVKTLYHPHLLRAAA